VRQRPTSHHEKLEDVVEAGGIALTLGNYREELGDVLAEHVRR
jgi:hypothetical protein